MAWDEEEDLAAGKERLDVFWKGSSDYHVKDKEACFTYRSRPLVSCLYRISKP